MRSRFKPIKTLSSQKILQSQFLKAGLVSHQHVKPANPMQWLASRVYMGGRVAQAGHQSFRGRYVLGQNPVTLSALYKFGKAVIRLAGVRNFSLNVIPKVYRTPREHFYPWESKQLNTVSGRHFLMPSAKWLTGNLAYKQLLPTCRQMNLLLYQVVSWHLSS